MKPVITGKRRRPASASPPLPRQSTHDEDTTVTNSKKRRLEPPIKDVKRPKRRKSEPEKSSKRRRSVTPPEDKTVEIQSNDETKRRRVEDQSSTSLSRASLPVNLSERDSETGTRDDDRATEEKARFPPSPLVIPSIQEEDEVSKENRRDATYTNLDEFLVSSQGSDADLVADLKNDLVNCSQDSQNGDVDGVRHRTSLRSVQVTPPPSARMLDRKNPPPPPKRPKRRNYGGIVYARTYPRLALSPLVDGSPPNSPRVFRSLENDFAFTTQDTPEIRPRIRPAPRMARGSRRSTRAGYSRARRSLDTPTSTMVLRSRQLNPGLSTDGGKPENQREREQRDAQRRQ